MIDRTSIVLKNINEPKYSEEALKTSELRYRRLFETSQDGIFILDFETGEISDVNPFLVEMSGYSREDFIGRKLWEVKLFSNVATANAAFLELQEKGSARYNDLMLEARDGKTIAVEFVGNVYVVNDTKMIQCHVRDITTGCSLRKFFERQLTNANNGWRNGPLNFK